MAGSKAKASAKFLIIRGLHGVGKTTLATEIKKIIGDRCVILDPDCIDTQSADFRRICNQIPSQIPEKFFPYRYLLHQASESLLQGKIVTWCQAWTQLSGIQKALTTLKKNVPAFDSYIIDLSLPRKTIQNRLIYRKKVGGNCLVHRSLSDFEKKFENITDDRLFTIPVIKLDASLSPAELARVVCQAAEL